MVMVTLAALMGCSGDEETPDTRVCRPGVQRDCFCNGAPGVVTCKNDGSGFHACHCPECVDTCDGRECGMDPNNCGMSCGTCSGGETCDDGTCVAMTMRDAGVRDAGEAARDGGSPDAGARDGGPRDGGPRDGGFVCGDGTVDPGEDCDDGNNTDDGNGCSATCTRVGACGDGALEALFEDCDDGNTTDDGNGCSETCTRVGTCGDGALEALFEDCDDGNTTDDGNGCSATCTRVGACGDGAVQSLFEICDGDPCCDAGCAMAAPPSTICRAAAFDCDVDEVCDGAAFTCPADALAMDGVVCNDCTAGAGRCDACLDGACADRPFFCADLLTETPTATDGVYAINPAVTPTTGTTLESVYCDMTGGGWMMVHKKSRTAPGDASDLWVSGSTNAGNLALLDQAMSTENYVSSVVGSRWSEFSQVRLEVRTGTVVAKFIEFDAVGSDYLSWFAPDRHTSSSWLDLPTDPNWQNNNGRFFTIVQGSRDWYINLQWGGCPSDRGWLMLTRGNFCYWEANSGDPVEIIYSVGTSHGSAPSATQTAYGDSLIVWVR
jgi:cysteine-rich repeat protein